MLTSKTAITNSKGHLYSVAFLSLFILLHGLWTVFHWGGAAVTGRIAGLPSLIPGLIAVAAAVWRAGREPSEPLRRGWTTLAVALGLYSLGLAIWGYDTVVYAAIPFPTLADALFVIFPWLMFAALFQLVGWQLSPANRARVVLNTLIVLFSLGLTEWALLLRHTLLQADSLLSGVAAVLYPLGDLVMLGGVVFVLQQAGNRERRVFLLPLLAGIGLFVLGDLIYTLQIASGNYHAATPLDLTWSLGLACFAVAALRAPAAVTLPAPSSAVPAAVEAAGGRVLSGVVLVLKLSAYASLLPIMLSSSTRLSEALVAVTVVAVLAVLTHLRQLVDSRENDGLNLDLQASNEQLGGRVEAAVGALEVRNVELARQTEQLGRRNGEIQTFGDLADLLQACLTLEEARGLIVQAATRLLSGTRGSIAVINSSRNLIETFAVWGEQTGEHSAQVFAPQDCWALRRGHAHLLKRDGEHLSVACQQLRGNVPSSYLCLPLVAQGETLGVLRLSSDGAQDVEILQGAAQNMARQVALALANLQLRETLRRQSIRDALTGLHNRRYLEETLEREVHRAARAHLPLSVLLLDVDHFKKFNDTFGHAAGDAVLQEVGKVMRGVFREEDIVCRYGGEEFVVALVDTDESQALRRAEQLREAVEHMNLTFREQSLGTVTISLGVAVLTLPAMKDVRPEDLIRMADEALYQAKRGGRNRVVLSGTPATPAIAIAAAS